MKLPSDAAIPLEKLTHYLLVPRTHGDKFVLDVRTIWIQVRRDMTFRFVTLLPLKGARR